MSLPNEYAHYDSAPSPDKKSYATSSNVTGKRRDFLKHDVSRAMEEHTVRTYLCTYYNAKLLGMVAEGFLSITNKRVMMRAVSHSSSGNSVIQSEVPIVDISGITSYKGFSFSLLHMLGAFIASALCVQIVMMIVAAFGTVTAFASDSAQGTAVLMLIVSLGVAIGAFIYSLNIDKDKIWRPVVTSISAGAFAGVGGISLLGGLTSSLGAALMSGSFGRAGQAGLIGSGLVSALFGIVAVGLSIYALTLIFNYARRPTFALSINSKGGGSTPIAIAGGTGFSLLTVGAEKALTAQPGADAEGMLNELGAVILDIQQMGELGVDKWSAFKNG